MGATEVLAQSPRPPELSEDFTSRPEPRARRCPLSHFILYRRPETGDALTRISVPSEVALMRQVRRLQALGYTIVDIAEDIAAMSRAR